MNIEFKAIKDKLKIRWRIKYVSTLLLLLVVLHQSVFSQSAPKYSNEFLQIGVGARSLGMGGAVISSTRNVYSGYWNPAGLIGIESNSQVSLMHAAYFAGIANYDYGAYAAKLNNDNAIGISLIRFGIDGIANTYDIIRNGEIDYSRVTSFNATDFAAILSYAQKAQWNRRSKVEFSWGANMKIVRRKIGPFAKATGFGFDAGMQWIDEKHNWGFGVTARDVTSTFNSWRYTFTDAQKEVLAATQNIIPKNTLEVTLPRLIAGYYKKWEVKDFTFLTEANAHITLDGKRNTLLKTNFISLDPAIGGEIAYNINKQNTAYFRTGVNNYQTYTNKSGKKIVSVMPNIGIGFTFGKFTLDYALTNLTALSGNGPTLYSNVFSLKLDINKNL